MEKLYLGISLGFNSSACVYSNERGLLAAISQERLNGQKNTKEFPLEAALKCLEIVEVKEVDCLAISHYETITTEYFAKHYKGEFQTTFIGEEIIFDLFREKGISLNQIIRVDHHTAHGLSTFAFYPAPKNNNFTVITSDGFGDGFSGTITNKEGKLSTVKLENSIGLVYQFVTGALGFKEHQHEGKITGLAAYGKPIYLYEFENMYKRIITGNFLSFTTNEKLTPEEIQQAKDSNIIDFDKYLLLKKSVYNLVADLIIDGATREDIAATVQEFAEKHTLKWIEDYCIDGGDAYLAGGLFANVKINQRIKDSGIFDNVYVSPPMGDEGTAVGAAIWVSLEDGGHIIGGKLRNVRCGTEVDGDEETFDFLCNEINSRRLQDKYRVRFTRNNLDLIDYMTNQLKANKIVCLMKGRMEFGPRALCNRSILYNATKKETNDSLNARLSRSEFMPFAPVCRAEVADDLFKNLDGGRDSARYMTMTFDGTDEFVNTYKAVAHIDGTARPQIIDRKQDSFMWNLLKIYEDKTELKCLVNTSFNLHNNPIIESELVGLESYLKADLDVLVIGNVIVEKIGE